ncbi:MAG TPA: phage holin family protein [Pyrinomonadaceae bacterium]|nr:phage holin family protein [Pyrinomonadaceae bacterium]
MATPKTAMTAESTPASPPETESLPSLVGRLGEDVMQLFDTKLSLLKVELKEEANTYARGAVTMAIGGIVAAVGFALLNVAIAFGVSTLFAQTSLSQPAKYALGFVLTGVFYLVIGGIVVLATKSRLAKQGLVPNRTVEELRKDKQWLKNEL